MSLKKVNQVQKHTLQGDTEGYNVTLNFETAENGVPANVSLQAVKPNGRQVSIGYNRETNGLSISGYIDIREAQSVVPKLLDEIVEVFEGAK